MCSGRGASTGAIAPPPAPGGGRRLWYLRPRRRTFGSAMAGPPPRPMHSAPEGGAAGLSRACPPCDKSGWNAKEVHVIAVTATLKAKPGREQDLARAVQTLAQKVRANEPDCKLYQLARSKNDPTLFVLLERYTDDAALARHSNTDYFKAGIPEMMALVEGRPEIRLFDEI